MKNTKKILVRIFVAGVIIILGLCLTRMFTPKAIGEEPKSIEPEKVNHSIEELVSIYAQKYNVSGSEMLRVLKCENNTGDPKLQSTLRYDRDHPEWGVVKGEQEKSFGYCQIHLPSHPDVTYEQAIDPEFCVEFMAKKFSEHHESEWMCY